MPTCFRGQGDLGRESAAAAKHVKDCRHALHLPWYGMVATQMLGAWDASRLKPELNRGSYHGGTAEQDTTSRRAFPRVLTLMSWLVDAEGGTMMNTPAHPLDDASRRLAVESALAGRLRACFAAPLLVGAPLRTPRAAVGREWCLIAHMRPPS